MMESLTQKKEKLPISRLNLDGVLEFGYFLRLSAAIYFTDRIQSLILIGPHKAELSTFENYYFAFAFLCSFI